MPLRLSLAALLLPATCNAVPEGWLTSTSTVAAGGASRVYAGAAGAVDCDYQLEVDSDTLELAEELVEDYLGLDVDLDGDVTFCEVFDAALVGLDEVLEQVLYCIVYCCKNYHCQTRKYTLPLLNNYHKTTINYPFPTTNSDTVPISQTVLHSLNSLTHLLACLVT